MGKHTINIDEDYFVTYSDDQETKDKVFDKLISMFRELELFSGESIVQSDYHFDIVDKIGEIADDIFE